MTSIGRILCLLLLTALCGVLTEGLRVSASQQSVRRMNILWISTEDISPDLGCYGDAYVDHTQY